MDLIDRLKELAGRIKIQKDSISTEEATKTAFILPFLQVLGYDIFNPFEVVPEFTADHGVKKAEKVDYAIKLDEHVAIIIECKIVGSELSAQHASQLYRYFSVTDARFGVLTDGIRYFFFSDLDKENQMDDRPFFVFDILQFGEHEVNELKKFTKASFDLDTIIGNANNLKYHRALLQELIHEFESPTEELVRLLTARVYSGRFTQPIKEQFTELTHKALRDFIRTRVNERLKNALADTEPTDSPETPKENPIDVAPSNEVDDGIETTPEEMEAFRIIQAVGSEIIDPTRIFMRDAKAYCAILWEDNNRKPICRVTVPASNEKMSVSGWHID